MEGRLLMVIGFTGGVILSICWAKWKRKIAAIVKGRKHQIKRWRKILGWGILLVLILWIPQVSPFVLIGEMISFLIKKFGDKLKVKISIRRK